MARKYDCYIGQLKGNESYSLSALSHSFSPHLKMCDIFNELSTNESLFPFLSLQTCWAQKQERVAGQSVF